jgi:hypothetical protein
VQKDERDTRLGRAVLAGQRHALRLDHSIGRALGAQRLDQISILVRTRAITSFVNSVVVA